MDPIARDQILSMLKNLIKEHEVAIESMSEKTDNDKLRVYIVKNNLGILFLLHLIVEYSTDGGDVSSYKGGSIN